jgi:hypothetical protein
VKDMRAHVEKLRVQLAECELIRDLATDPSKRELFARLAERLKVVVAEFEEAARSVITRTFLCPTVCVDRWEDGRCHAVLFRSD